MYLKRQNLYFLLEDSRSLLSPFTLDISILLIGWNSLLSLFSVTKKEEYYSFSLGSMQNAQSYIERGEGWKGEHWDSASTLFPAAILFSQGRAVFIRDYVHFLSSLWCWCWHTGRFHKKWQQSVNYQRTPRAEIVLVHIVPAIFLSCSAMLYK